MLIILVLVFCSIGKIHSNKTVLLEKIVNSVLKTGFNVLVSTGKSNEHINNPNPSRVLFFKSVNQIEILQKCSFFIHHGGMNSTIEAINFHTPMLIIPQTVEQLLVGYRVQEINKGNVIPLKNPTQNLLDKTLLELLKKMPNKSTI